MRCAPSRKMNVEGRWRRTIELAGDGRSVVVLDQAKLPYAIEWLALTSLDGVARAIRAMHIRGGPVMGVTAAYGIGIAMRDGVELEPACELLAATRPTAINLRWALDHMRRELTGIAASEREACALAAAGKLAE